MYLKRALIGTRYSQSVSKLWHDDPITLLSLETRTVDTYMNWPRESVTEGHTRPAAPDQGVAATILDSLGVHIAVLDEALAIVHTNAAWRAFAQAHPSNAILDWVGIDYLSAMSSLYGVGERQVRTIADGIRSVLNGEHAEFHQTYACDSSEERRWHTIRVTPIENAGKARLVVADIAVSEVMMREACRAAALDGKDTAPQELGANERFVRAVADALPAMVAYWDSDLHCRFANSRYKEWFGKSADEVVGIHIRELLGEEVFALNEAFIRGALAGQPQNFERSLTKADGSVGHTWANYIPDRKPDGTVAGFFVLVSDVTLLKEAQAKLRLAASVIANTVEGVVVADANGLIESVNPAYTKITGFREDELIGKKQHIFAVDGTASDSSESLQRSLDTQGHWQGQVWNRRKNGESFLEWKSVNKIVDASGRIEHYVSVFSDITEFWRRDEEIRRLAFHDALTGLPNRALLNERLTQLLAMAQREERNLAVLFLDLDGFKLVNDTRGHDVGDLVLIAAANHLQALVRGSDTVARLGGDEFVVVLDNPQDNDEVALIATRIIARINDPLVLKGETVRIGTSIGIALHPIAGHTADQLIRSADTAMYAAKKDGKNTFRFAGSPQL